MDIATVLFVIAFCVWSLVLFIAHSHAENIGARTHQPTYFLPRSTASGNLLCQHRRSRTSLSRQWQRLGRALTRHTMSRKCDLCFDRSGSTYETLSKGSIIPLTPNRDETCLRLRLARRVCTDYRTEVAVRKGSPLVSAPTRSVSKRKQKPPP